MLEVAVMVKPYGRRESSLDLSFNNAMEDGRLVNFESGSVSSVAAVAITIMVPSESHVQKLLCLQKSTLVQDAYLTTLMQE